MKSALDLVAVYIFHRNPGLRIPIFLSSIEVGEKRKNNATL